MKIRHILLAAVVATIALASSASAQEPYQYGMPYGPGMGAPGVPGCETPEMAVAKQKYGWHPWLKDLFCSKGECKEKGTGFFGKSKKTTPPAATGGTLVFPHNPYVRSPRDWFMED